MLCYRDKTFCVAGGKTCGNTECHRYFTQQDELDAKRWWGGTGAPIALSNFSVGCEDFQPLRTVVGELSATETITKEEV